MARRGGPARRRPTCGSASRHGNARTAVAGTFRWLVSNSAPCSRLSSVSPTVQSSATAAALTLFFFRPRASVAVAVAGLVISYSNMQRQDSGPGRVRGGGVDDVTPRRDVKGKPGRPRGGPCRRNDGAGSHARDDR